MERRGECAVRRSQSAHVAEPVRVVTVGEVAAHVPSPGLGTQGRDVGEQLTQVQQVGGLPRLGPPSSPSACAARVASANAVLSNDSAERTTPEPLVIARWMAFR